MSSTLKRITSRAKQIYKKHPSMKWTSAIKQASKELKGKGATKKTTRKKAARRKTRKKVSGDLYIKHEAIGSISKTESTYRKQLRERLKDLLYKRDCARLKRAKRHWSKQISEVRRKLKTV